MAKKQKMVERKPKPRVAFVDVFREIVRGDDDLISSLSESRDGGPIIISYADFEMTIYPSAKQLYADAREAARLELLDRLTKEVG